jgi:hypothetical protein
MDSTTSENNTITPFNPGEFQAILRQMREGRRPDDYTLFCMAEQIEANRLDIEKARCVLRDLFIQDR